MSPAHLIGFVLLLLACGTATTVWASALRVAPSTVDLPAPARVGSLTLRSDGREAGHYQIRVYRWLQEDGAERLVPTDDVVVSPPITQIAPGLDYVVRIVRLAKRPVTREESYRVIVDELPGRKTRADRTVSFLIRYSVPVFFSPPDASPKPLIWRLALASDRLMLSARNSGRRRTKVANLRLRDARGRTVVLAKGLAGYVLAGAERDWHFEERRIRELVPGPAHLLFQTDSETIDVPVSLPGHS